jgi:polyhydroxyalkanoate synthesis regulator phasin
MIDSIKKTILAGVGAAVVTKEKVQAGLEEFVKQGKLSAADAQAMAEKIAQEGRREFESASAKLGDAIRDLMATSGDKYIARIEALEARVSALEGKSAAGAKRSKS